ncbi:hypothetical protein JZ751_007625 [Albula glossodonta]|uniref:Equilibrative nucleoside transporter 2 n=1 Tax=Albula glossodonta TaxID=121402 RepID=A0A8T2MMA7_9TELE|nr:hypothetical protein JZ751_007625 [Albula glossodonta]
MKAWKDAPVDRGYLVAAIFFILGLGTLLPWNFFMTATMYFQDRLNTSEWSNGTVVIRKEYYFNNWMTLLSQLPLLLFTFLNSFLYQRIAEKVRITGSLIFIFLLFVLTTILSNVWSRSKRDRYDCTVCDGYERRNVMSLTVFERCSRGVRSWERSAFGGYVRVAFGAVLQGSLFGLVGLLPQSYSAVFMSGQGLAGTFAALAMLVSIFSDAGKEAAALGYFITPCVGTLITLLSYMLLPHLEFAQYYFNKSKNYEPETNHELLIKGSEATKTVENGKLNGHTNGSIPNGNGTVVYADTESDGTAQAFIALESGNTKEGKLSVMQVFKKIWVMAFCVTFVFIVTLSVFPAITVDVKTEYENTKWEVYFIPVCCFLIFNVMDWIGRTVTTWVQWPPKESPLFPALVVARVIFIPLIMLCNIRNHYYLPVLFAHDAMLVESKDAETAGALMTFFLALGLSLGAALSFPLRVLV